MSKRRWWWPFGHEELEAENQFLEMLEEASLRTDDLKSAAAEMRAERLRRIKEARGSTPSLQTG